MLDILDNNGKHKYDTAGTTKFVKPGQWHLVGGDYHIPVNTKSVRFYVQIPEAGVNYLADDAEVTLVHQISNFAGDANGRIDHLRKANLDISLQGSSSSGLNIEVQQLKSDFGWGSAVNVDSIHDSAHHAYQKFFYDTFEWAVLENALKWRALEGSKGQFSPSKALHAVDAMLAKGIKVRGHNIFWGGDKKVPSWQISMSGAELKPLLEKHIQDMTKTFKGKFQHWDVENENLHLHFYEDKLNDPDITQWMFRETHRLDPHTKCYLNDYSVVSSRLSTLKFAMESRRTWFDSHKTHFEYIVAGCGGIGSATVYWLAKRAQADVLGIEQFELGHHNGGSQDHSRIFRMAYHDEKYTKLTRPAAQAWETVEEESGVQLLYKFGGLDISKPSEVDLQCYEDAMKCHNVRYEKLNAEQLQKKFPQFKVDKDVVSLYQPEAGLVDAALSNSVHQQLARGYGASFLTNCSVVGVHRNNDGLLLIKTTKGDFTCRQLLVTSGSWTNTVLGSIGVHLPLIITQEQVTYFGTPHIKEFTKNRFPVFSYIKPDYSVYQIPVHGRSGPKVGIDSFGKRVTPHTRDFKPSAEVEKFTTDFMENILPKFIGPVLETKTCLYDMLPDRNFLIDTCDKVGYSDVIVCIGSAHAFKFACLLGKILSEMAIDGRSQYDISGFSMNRPAITDPNFRPFLVFQAAEPKSKL